MKLLCICLALLARSVLADPIYQSREGAIGCSDKLFISEASDIERGKTHPSDAYVFRLWQRGTCGPLVSSLRLQVLERETLNLPIGSYRIARVAILNPANPVGNDPLYMIEDDLRPIAPAP